MLLLELLLLLHAWLTIYKFEKYEQYFSFLHYNTVSFDCIGLDIDKK